MNYEFASTREFYASHRLHRRQVASPLLAATPSAFYGSRRGRRLSQRTLAALAFTALPSVPNRRCIQAIAMYALRVLRFLREIIIRAREEKTLRDNK